MSGVYQASRINAQHGFALPTILVISTVMLIALVAAISSATTVRSSLNQQYYSQLGREAAESGLARATSCLRENNYNAIWLSNTNPARRTLNPASACSGDPITGASNYVRDGTDIKTTFSVDNAVLDTAGTMRVTVTGITQLIRTSNGSIYQANAQTISSQSKFVDQPQIAGGAGWKSRGHNGYMLASTGVLYGWGDNGSGQLGASALGSYVGTPTRMDLPSGVDKVLKIFNSGQGASIICILAGDGQIYCRGDGGLGGAAWQRFALPAGLTATDMSVNGYGSDSACVIASNTQVYCAGDNTFGTLGNGATSYSFVPITAPTRLLLPAGVGAKQVFTQDTITCIISDTDDAYCAGRNDLGQLGRGNITTNIQGYGNSIPAKSLMPVKVNDIKLTYHGSYVGVYYMGADNSVYMSGHNGQGTANDGQTSYTTYYSTPRRITSAGIGYASFMSIGEQGNNKNSICIIRQTIAPTIWCIGNNSFGQLGDGTCTDRGSWVVYQLPAGESASTAMNLESGYQMNSMMIITQSGKVFSAGDNRAGKLGTNSSLQTCNGTPKEVVMPLRSGSATERVKAIALTNSDEYTAYILGSDGAIYATGLNGNGQLGNGAVDAGVVFTGDTLTSPGTPSRVPVSIAMPRVITSY